MIKSEVFIMKEINYLDTVRLTTERLANGGVFLTVKGDPANTMTIGWGSVGYAWNKPVFTVMVRPQRHSFEMIRKAGEFTVSVPTVNPLKDELIFAGTKSGRDLNKFDGHGLTAVPGQKIDTPIIGECGLHFECRTLFEQDITPDTMVPELANGTYKANDFHTLFFGEIVACYTTDEE